MIDFKIYYPLNEIYIYILCLCQYEIINHKYMSYFYFNLL